MKLKYYPETDTFYIELKNVPSIETEEITAGVVLNYDEKGQIVGIEIEKLRERQEIEIPIVGKFLKALA